MRFISAANRARYVVPGRPAHKELINGITPVTVKGLQAKFVNHHFDSSKAQTELGWTDDDRKMVESYLMGHRDYDHPRGFYLELVDGEARPTRTPATPGQRRCIAFIRNERNESEQCPAVPVEGSEYCAEHEQVAEAAMAGEAT